MPITNVTTAGTRVQLTTSSAPAARITVQRKAANTQKIYIGIAGNSGGINTGASVSSSAYDAYLDASNPSLTVGLGETMGNVYDAQNIWIDSDVNGEGVAWFVENI